jgi:hypothetical protein
VNLIRVSSFAVSSMALGKPSLAGQSRPQNTAHINNGDSCSYVVDSDGLNDPINTRASAYIKKVHDKNQSERLVSGKLDDYIPPPPPLKYAMYYGYSSKLQNKFASKQL